MVGKPYRKKQAVLQQERFGDLVPIEILGEIANSEIPQEILEFFGLLKSQSSSQDQNRVVQTHKRKFRSILCNFDISNDKLFQILEPLLNFYLLPQYFPFHTSMEWIVGCMGEISSSKNIDFRSFLAKVCLSILDIFTQDTKTLDTQFLQLWLPSIASITLIDRDFGWLSSAETVSSGTILRFINTLISIIRVNNDYLEEANNNSNISTPDIIQRGGISTEGMRCLVILLKNNKQFIFSQKLDPLFKEKFAIFSQISQSILFNVLSQKDSLTSAGSLLLFVKSLGDSEEEISLVIFDYLHSLFTENETKDFGSTPKCSLLRAALTSLSPSQLIYHKYSQTLIDFILHHILKLCVQGDSQAQLYALQTIEVWISKLREFTLLPNFKEYISPDKIVSVSKVVCNAWNHPARQVSHVVAAVYEHLIKTTLKLFGDPLLDNSEESSVWSKLLLESMKMPSFHRGKYQAIKIVLDQMNILFFLNLQPNLIKDLILSIKDRDIAPSVSLLISTILQKLYKKNLDKREITTESFSTNEFIPWCRKIETITTLALCSTTATLRLNIADYLLPELLQLDLKIPYRMLTHINSLKSINNSMSVEWAIVQITLHAKLLGIPIIPSNLLLSEEAKLVMSLITAISHSASLAYDDHLRLASIISITASLKSTIPLSKEDFELLKNVLVYSLKTNDIDNCSKLERTMKSLLQRSAVKSISLDNISEFVQYEDVYKWIISLIKEHLYPGITFDKEYCLLYILNVLFSNNAIKNNQISIVELQKQYIDQDLVRFILNCYLTCWDKSRKLSTEIINRIPCPWPGYDNIQSIHNVLIWGKLLAQSARLRESDAGAQILSTLFESYAIKLGWNITQLDMDSSIMFFPQDLLIQNESSPSNILFAAIRFIEYLCWCLDSTLNSLETIFASIYSHSVDKTILLSLDQQFPLAHGLVSAIRLCMISLKRCEIMSKYPNFSWFSLSKVVSDLTFKALNLAMTVVAEAKTDVPFAPFAPKFDKSSEGSDNNELITKGPINSSVGYSMAATYVNTNSFMSISNSEETESIGSDEIGSKAQRAIVAAWLLVKEATTFLSTLVTISPVPPSDNNLKPSDILLDAAGIEMVGDKILDALGRLKHMGAISEAHVALQAIATTLLRYGDKNPKLNALPGVWLNNLIDRLRNKQQVFILRRSAGFAYSFLSLLRAEPANCTPLLLHNAVTSLLGIIERGLQAQSSSQVAEIDDEDWKLSVHSLNVLRLILLDGAFGTELDIHIPKTFTLAVTGFASPHWSVRNSSMMVFSAAIQRSIARNKNDASGSMSVTARDFFSRFQGLFEFLYNILFKITNEISQVSKSETKENIELEDSLYPLLLMFAKFRVPLLSSNPILQSEEKLSFELESFVQLDIFLPLFHRCLGNKVSLIRTMAARAFSALVPLSESPLIIQDLTQKLISKLETKKLTLNMIHGSCLQIKELLQQLNIQSSLSDIDNAFFHQLIEKLQICVLPLIQTLSNHLNIIRCPPIQTVFLNILTILIELINTPDAQRLIKQLLLNVSSNSIKLNMLVGNSFSLSQLPFEPWLLRDSFKHLVIQTLSDTVMEPELIGVDTCIDMIADPLREIREGVVLGFINSLSNSHALTLLNKFHEQLIEVLLVAIKQENEPLIIQPQLQLLQHIVMKLIPKHQLSSTAFTSIFDTLLTLLGYPEKVSKVSTIRNSISQSLEILGYCMGLILRVDQTICSSVQRLNYLNAWKTLFIYASSEEQPIDVRISAAQGLANSRLFEDFVEIKMSMSQILQGDSIWESITMELIPQFPTLLQDDDDEVRAIYNFILCNTLPFLANKLTSIQYIEDFTLNQIPNIVAAFVKCPIEKDHQLFYSNIFSSFFLQLNQVQGTLDSLLLSLNSTNKIFEAELPNVYIEPIRSGEIYVQSMANIIQILLNPSETLPEQIKNDLMCYFVDQVKGLTRLQEFLVSKYHKVEYDRELFKYLYLLTYLLSALMALNLDLPWTQSMNQLISICESLPSSFLHPSVLQNIR